MGDHGGWAQTSSSPLNGLHPDAEASVTRVLDTDRWTVAEARTAKLIERIQPNQRSEERRNEVAIYVQRLIMKCFPCQVFTFGSVPLKTYLPDGDIDMTAFSKNLNLKDTWANEVRGMLENEEKSENAEFRVKEVQYIQAEVKLIKCLVENIVVDISFNQLGGLCTLCFLEQIDQTINQDHLFKRSIILIKAWCYYESRILGAHHGLISTYALEILVLYIFHIFNNSFAGPLEVLFRFLVFFSNFDWDNFCVSLWGPVPISLLPDMTAEPPRKDDGKLLFSKHELDTCSSMYSVFPGGQENQGQSFVSKFFNVIDPLRTNNNLGRSVSKGNFYRIRSAFAFGAKRLAGLLECSKDEVISEVDKFFMNTWRQHGAGHRPDAPSPNLWNIESLSNTESEGCENFGNHAGQKMLVENGPLVAHGYDVDLNIAPGGITCHPVSSVNQHAHNRTGSLSVTSAQTQMQKAYVGQYSSRVAECIERSISSSGHVSSDRAQRASRPDNLVNEYEGSGRSQFARTRSRPELSDTPADVSSRRRNKMPETAKNQLSSARSGHMRGRKNGVSEMAGNRSGQSSSNDLSSVRHCSSNQDFDLTTDSSCTSNSYHEDTDSVAKNEEFISFPEVLEMHQEEQDLINMMAASRVSNLNAQVQHPMSMPSAPLPLPSSSSVVASMGYLQRNLAGMLPQNIPLMKPPWGSVIQFPHDLDSSQMPSYYSNTGLVSNPEEFVESGNESSSITEAEVDDVDHGFWQDQDNGSISLSIAGDRNIQMLHSDDKTVSSTAALNSSSLRVNNSSGSFLRGQHKFARDNRGFVKEDGNDALSYQINRGQDTYTTDRNMNSRFMTTTQTSSSRSKSSSESSWDGSSMKVSRLSRDKHGRKMTSNAVPSLHVKSKNGWQYEDSSSDHVSVSAEDDNREWIPLSTFGTDAVERSSGSTSLGPVESLETHAHHSSGYEPTQTSSSDSVVPVSPVLVSAGSRPRTEDDNGAMPFAFYPTGPPVPFLAMLPVYPYDSGNSNGSTGQLDNGRLENGHINPSDHKLGSAEDLKQPVAHNNTSSMDDPSFQHSEGHKPDILNSDLASHWQNLQFGRFCQNTRYHGPLMYSSPVVIPPVYLQGHFPWDGPGRPLLANMNLLTQIMNYGPQLVPMAPLQPSQSRSSSSYRGYGDEVPRYRSGTGTYLPNPKVSFRDRQPPSTRHHRGGFGYERRDHGDREGSWINSKSRAAGRSHGRNQAEKSSSKSEWSSVADNRPDKSWDSYRREPVASYQNQNSSFNSTNIQGSGNMAYGMYPLPAVNSNGVNAAGPTIPSVMMLYSYDRGASYASSSEQLEFGSLGPVHLSRTNEVTQDMDGGHVRDSFDQRQGAYEQDSAHSSPDQPSSPHVHRRSTVQRNYQLKDEDFPPLSFPQRGGTGAENYDYKSSRYQSSHPHS